MKNPLPINKHIRYRLEVARTPLFYRVLSAYDEVKGYWQCPYRYYLMAIEKLPTKFLDLEEKDIEKNQNPV